MEPYLKRSEFAYLFHKLFEKYRLALSHHSIDPPVKQEDILGYGHAARIKGTGISQSNRSLSHVVYFDLWKRKYQFERNGFKREVKEGTLRLQGGELQNAYLEYNNGYSKVYLSPSYLKAYLFYLGITRDNLETFSATYDNVPPLLVIPFSSNKRRGVRPGVPVSQISSSEIIFDIFLAAPILTLGLKIQENYEAFKNTLKDLLGTNFTQDVEEELIKHFFGFTTNDLQGEFEQFERSIEDLKGKLESLGLRVFYSREGVKVRNVSPVAQSQKQFIDDVEQIRKSKTYILISPYPRLFSSAWVESGAAVNMGKPCLFFCSQRKTDLPFVLQERSGTLNFDVSDSWNIKREISDEELQKIAEGIRDWTKGK